MTFIDKKTSATRNNKKKQKSFDEAILLPRNSSRNSYDFQASSISFSGVSNFSGFYFVEESKIVEKKAYPLPRPSGSPEPSIKFDQRIAGFGSGTVLASSTVLAHLGPVLVHDQEDFGSFRALEETNWNSWSRTSCLGSKATTIHASPQHPLPWIAGLESPSHPSPFHPDSPIKPSQHLQSKWKKGKLLGRGTFGHVYAGFNSENGQMCAMKEVRVNSDDQTSKECLKSTIEIALLIELSHPNIVQYYGSKLGEDTLSMFLEYVSGGSIHKLLREYSPFKEPVIQSYTRDIKGANILVDPKGDIKLVDFGMAKHISSCSSMLSFEGSPYWMAPEVIQKMSGYSLAVDIWSLGCTIHEMATSKPPWSQYEGVAAIFKIANSKDLPEIPIYLSEDAQSFVKLCLQRDPSVRPTTAQLLQHPFISKIK